MCYTTENHSILFHTCEVLAGQLYPAVAREYRRIGRDVGSDHLPVIVALVVPQARR